jgi:hypothetical protein
MEMPEKTQAPRKAIVIELNADHHHALLKRASENSPLHFRLKNAVKTEANTILVPCGAGEADMLLDVAKHFCPDAVAVIEAAIKDEGSVIK